MNLTDTTSLPDPLINYISTCAGEVESTMPPVKADLIRDKLAALILSHLRQLEALTFPIEPWTFPTFRVVIRHAAIRIAHEFRIDYFHRTDKYFYWPSEVASLLSILAEGYTTSGASQLLQRSLEWNFPTQQNDIILATVAPSYLYASGGSELITTVADVDRGLALMPEHERLILQSRFLMLYRNVNRFQPSDNLVRLALRGLCEKLNRQPMPLSRKARRQLSMQGFTNE